MRYSKFFVIMLILVIFSSLASLCSPILLNSWLKEGERLIYADIILLLLLLVFTLVIELILIYFREKFAERFNIENFKNAINDYFHLSYDNINDKGPVNYIERIILAVNNIYIFMTGDFIRIWSSALIMIVVLGIVLFNNPTIAVIMVVMAVINYFGYRILNKQLAKHSKKMQEATASGWQEVISITSNTDYLKQCDSYEEIIKQMAPAMKRIYGSMAKLNTFAQSTSRMLSGINGIAQVMIMVLIVYGFMESNSSPINLVLYTILIPLYSSNLSIITNSNLSKRDMDISMDFLKDLKDSREEDGTKNIEEINSILFDIPELKIKDIILVNNIEDKFQKGDIVWVKGESGTGKSTLLKMIMKFRTTDTILVNDENIKNITNKSLRKRVEYLSQNVPIIKGTLRDNIFYNREYDLEIEKKLIKDDILQSILKDKSFDSIITENGSNLSGGEKQKIAIARILYADIDVLILDEVTSNIDENSSIFILKRLMDESKGRITFIISHNDLPKEFVNKTLDISHEHAPVK